MTFGSSASSTPELSTDSRHPVTVGINAATNVGMSPRWVLYSGVSPTAVAVADILSDLVMNLRERPVLNREFIAYAAGLSRADKLAPFLAELERVGFLTIDSPINPTTGKRRQARDRRGRPLPDRFAIDLHPPAGYAGPKTLTDIYEQFAKDRSAAYADAEQSKSAPGLATQRSAGAR
jgi:hypothetical protein